MRNFNSYLPHFTIILSICSAFFTIVPDGEATLSVRLEGPGQCELVLRETEHCGVYEAQYVVHEQGEYTLHLLADGKPVGDGPLRVFAVRDSKSVLETIEKHVQKQLLSTTNEMQTQQKQHSLQTTEKTKKKDKLDKETVVVGEKQVKQQTVEEIEETYIECEFKLVLHGAGLTSGHVVVGRKYTFVVDTRLAPSGKLNVKVDGPGNVDLDLALCDEGYSVQYMADEPGDYHFTLKYDGQVLTKGPLAVHVLPADAPAARIRLRDTCSVKQTQMESETKSAPVAARVTEIRDGKNRTGPPNPAAVQFDTSRLTRTVVGQTCELLVDCENAGEGKLEASLDGIRSAEDQLTLSHHSNRVFKVIYKINQPGDYKLVLRWAGQPLPGSPFTITAA